MLTAWMMAGFAGFVIWLSVRSMKHEKASRDRVREITTRTRDAHGIEAVFVSPEDGSYVGLSHDRTRLVVGRAGEERLVPMGEVVAVEGVRDDVVLVRADRNGGPAPAPSDDRNPANLPERIRWLGLRIFLADEEEHPVLFFDGGKHGVEPVNAAFRRQAGEVEAWFRTLSAAMRLAGD